MGIWFYVRDNYPFQIDAGEITGLVYHSVASGGPVSGYVGSPPGELADWISGMEKTSVAESSPASTVVTIVRSDGPSLRIAIDGSRGYASWVSADGSATPAVGLHLNAAVRLVRARHRRRAGHHPPRRDAPRGSERDRRVAAGQRLALSERFALASASPCARASPARASVALRERVALRAARRSLRPTRRACGLQSTRRA